MKSIALIGMPGCGKTTIGKLLARKLNYEFVDMDKFIEKTSKKTVKELFAISEEHFRDIESDACKTLSDLSKAVIATGGGVVKREDNIQFLRKNCVIVFIDRTTEDILADIDYKSRPLLADDYRENLCRLYNERYALYKKYSDFWVVNNKSLGCIVGEIADYVLKFVK